MRRSNLGLWISGTLVGVSVLGMSMLNGCGGGGGGSSLTRGVSTNIFVTDTFRDDYSQVWVTLYSIDLQASGSSTLTNVYTNSAGQQVNLADLAAKATLLNTISVPAGTYTSAKVTFGTTFTVTPKGSTTAKTVTVDPSIGTQSGGQVAITIPTVANLTPAQLGNVVIDFNLAAFQLIGNKLFPSVAQCSDSNFAGKSKEGDIEGTASAVTATGFTITRGSRNWTVVTNASTTTVSQSTGATATLANGNIVEVQGTVEPTTSVVTATIITINDIPEGMPGSGSGGHDDDHGGHAGGGTPELSRAQVVGIVTAVDAASGNITLTVAEAHHFKVSASTVIVATSSATKFKKPGAAATLTDVVVGGAVQANGSYNSTTNTVTATSVFVGITHH